MANIVVCADGTWNRPEEDVEKDYPTNVLKVARAINPYNTDLTQHVFYDWGLGSYHSSLIAGATGSGIQKNILDGYRYIVQNYNAKDKIYLFGFSRGAYTVRALSGLINNCGILKRAEASLITKAWTIYKDPSPKFHPNAKEAIRFRKNYSHNARDIHFIGVWDTVGALGIPFSLMGLFESHDEFYDDKMGPNIAIARHALAIDEKREDFKPTIWTPRPGVDLKQVWFSGVHTDIGGSYPPDKNSNIRASDTPLKWMLDEAVNAGLDIEPHVWTSLTDGSKGKLHKSRKHIYRFKKPLHRELVIKNKPTRIHPSVKSRYLDDSNYRPKALEKLVETFGWDNLDVGT
jgi:uncharacterized protein (DUF2235 family)